MPLFVISKGKRKKKEFCDAMPRGTFVKMSGSGYMNSEHFTLWRQHFHLYRFSEPVIPLLNGHDSYISNEEVMSLSDANSIHFYA
jgi:hypothetical protein